MDTATGHPTVSAPGELTIQCRCFGRSTCRAVPRRRRRGRQSLSSGCVSTERYSPDRIAALDAASDTTPAYPVWHQRVFPMLNEHGVP